MATSLEGLTNYISDRSSKPQSPIHPENLAKFSPANFEKIAARQKLLKIRNRSRNAKPAVPAFSSQIG